MFIAFSSLSMSRMVKKYTHERINICIWTHFINVLVLVLILVAIVIVVALPTKENDKVNEEYFSFESNDGDSDS